MSDWRKELGGILEGRARASRAEQENAQFDAFLQQVGRTPGDEIRRVRIDAAKRLLAETDEKVESAALRCGYQSLNSFCVAFKTATGKSPGQFRREARGTA